MLVLIRAFLPTSRTARHSSSQQPDPLQQRVGGAERRRMEDAKDKEKEKGKKHHVIDENEPSRKVGK